VLKIKFTKAKSLAKKPSFDNLKFGKVNTDYMLLADYKLGKWTNHRIVPFANLSIHPFSTVLHYGAEIFEGLKAYRTNKDDVQLFRLDENGKRFNESANRICLPEISSSDWQQMILEFVKVEKDWVPNVDGASLYLRPFMFANEEALGVHPPSNATFCLVASPVASYYSGGLKPVDILVETNDVRAVKGGTGNTKFGGNYAASLRASKLANEKGFAQVLWLDGIKRQYIEEVGAMNIAFVIDDVVVTPSLNGSILSGITRKSCIEILKSLNIKVEERPITIDEVIAAIKNGTLKECFGTGTAAVIAPVGSLNHNGSSYKINNSEIGNITKKLYDTLTGIQYGKIKDSFNWIVKI